jgi:hypothetical protein
MVNENFPLMEIEEMNGRLKAKEGGWDGYFPQ